MKIRILIIDDDRDLLTLIEKYLMKKHPDLDIIPCETAQDALRFLEESYFDAIVCDYYLGPAQMNGLELLEWLRAAGNNMPFVMFTGRSREEVAIRALNLGADFYLKKDQLDFEGLFIELIHHLRKAVETRQMQEALARSETQARLYLDLAGVIFVALDKDGNITLLNQTGCEILGCTQEEVLGRNWFSTFIPEAQRENVLSGFSRLMNGELEPVEYFENVILTSKGEERLIQWHNAILYDEQGTLIGTLSSGVDISEKKIAEQKLLFTQFAVENSSESAFWMGKDAKFIYVNNAACAALGYSREELLSMTVHDIDPLFTREIWPAHWNELLEKKSFTIESKHRRKDGQEFPVEILVNYVAFGGNEYNCAIVRDITEQIKSIRELEESERKHRLLVESMHDFVFVFDKNDCHSECYAPSIHDLYVPPDEFIGKHVSDVLPSEVAAQYLRFSELTRSDGQPRSYEYQLKKGDKIEWYDSTMSLHEDGESIVAVVRNITNRKEKQTEFADAHEFLEKVLDSLTHPFYVIDAIDYSVVLANSVARLGAIGDQQTCHQLTHNSEKPCDSDMCICPLAEVKETKKPVIVEHLHQDQDGNIRAFLVHGYPILDENSDVVQMIEYNLDVTKEREAFESLRRQKEELSIFAHQMSHDLTNYLLKIGTVTQLVESEQESSNMDMIRRLIGEVQRLLKHSVTLADAGLVIEKKDVVNLDILARSIATNHVSSEVVYRQETLPKVLGDYTKLRQVFQNLYDNAIKHGKPNTIEVSIQDTDFGVRVIIANDGDVIPSALRSKVLSSGLTTKREKEGFGLAVVQRIIAAHGWRITLLESLETSFAIDIPSSEIIQE
jgi:PAS domain S-box-containing protein